MTDSLPKRTVIDRVFSTKRSRALEMEVEAANDFLDRVAMRDENLMIDQADGSRTSIAEGLASVDMMLDAKGWTPIWEYDDISGLTLRQVKEASEQSRELVVGNPFIGNGARVRIQHVLGAGTEFGCRNRTGKMEAKPLPASIQNIIEEPWYLRYITGATARAEMERAAFTDGNFLVLGHDGDKRIQRVQLAEITGYVRNPNNSEEIWAYRRTWNPRPQRQDILPNVTNPGEPDLTQRTRWYYTDMFPVEERRPLIEFEGKNERAEVDYTMLDVGFNRQVGWPLGVPDALAVIAWSRLYKEFLANGYVMSRSLARLAFRLTLGTKKGKDKAAEISKPGQAGSTFLEGEGNTLTPLATAGKGYDFSSGDGLARAMAAGLGISLKALLSDPDTKQQATNFMVDPVAAASAAVRRAEWDDFYVRLFKWMGLTKKLTVTWRDHNDDTVARLMQALTLADQLEIFSAEVMQATAARVLDIGEPGAVPDGWKPFSQRKGSSENGTTGKSGSTAGTGQGDDDGTGDSGNDTRDQ